MVFPVPETSVLSGASVSQLNNWRRTGLFIPEIDATGRPLLYSFRDVIALRSVVKLRSVKSLQKIRKAFNNMPSLDLTEHPSEYSLIDTGASILVVKSDGEGIDVLANPGQAQLANLEEIMSAFRTEDGKDVIDLRYPRARLEVREQRLGGWPTIQGTRVPFDVVANLIMDGSVAASEVALFYPSVTEEAALDALDFARSVPNWSEAQSA